MQSHLIKLATSFVFSFVIAVSGQAQTNDSLPNVLLIIADDLGVDVVRGYGHSGLSPTTPTLDSLQNSGLTFNNAWSAPSCTPTRATIMSGKYGVKTGVLRAPGHLDTVHTSLFKRLDHYTDSAYDGAVVGKWHISQPPDPWHYQGHGVDHYVGVLDATVADYYSWNKTELGVTQNDTDYVTEDLTDEAISWINSRSKPWFLWLAHIAPHSPVHLPPASMYTISPVGSNFRKYLATIEALDYQIDRLLQAIPKAVQDNTVIIFIGDNGTPGNFIQDYPAGHGKGTLYQGGIRVPMFVSGKGVTRVGEREDALVHVNDIHATVLEIAGADLPGGINNSLSFKHHLDGSPGPVKTCNYSEITDTDVDGWTIRNERYKFVDHQDTTDEFFDLFMDSLEFNNLIGSLTPAQDSIKTELENEANMIRTAWSCKDHIQNGDEEGIDCGGTYCDECPPDNTGIVSAKGGNLVVYPNPTSGVLHLKDKSGSNLDGKSVIIYNLIGEVLGEQIVAAGSKEWRINLKEIPPQLLIISVLDNGGIYGPETFRIVKI